jgi:hypothetical protein
VPIITRVLSSKPTDGEVYSIQHYVIKFVNDLRQFDVFLRVPRFPPPIKLTATIVESGVEHHNPPLISMDPYQLAVQRNKHTTKSEQIII